MITCMGLYMAFHSYSSIFIFHASISHLFIGNSAHFVQSPESIRFQKFELTYCPMLHGLPENGQVPLGSQNSVFVKALAHQEYFLYLLIKLLILLYCKKFSQVDRKVIKVWRFIQIVYTLISPVLTFTTTNRRFIYLYIHTYTISILGSLANAYFRVASISFGT